MNKSAMVAEVAFATGMILLTLVGTMVIINNSDQIIVGDKTTMNAYEYSSCKEVISSISKEDIVILESGSDAERRGFTITRC